MSKNEWLPECCQSVKAQTGAVFNIISGSVAICARGEGEIWFVVRSARARSEPSSDDAQSFVPASEISGYIMLNNAVKEMLRVIRIH